MRSFFGKLSVVLALSLLDLCLILSVAGCSTAKERFTAKYIGPIDVGPTSDSLYEVEIDGHTYYYVVRGGLVKKE